ncbi:O-antigen/teichoic acid export membrane protein [Pseudonocardia eucalypti]|nr:O-antigen/teichoic acid export membrane protein [Pseudonocardia eucalypti]
MADGRTGLLWARARTAAPVGGGLALVGLAAYVILALAGHTLTPRDYTAAAAMFLITSIVGPGVFAAVEQQTNHEVSGRLAAGARAAATMRAAGLVCAGLALLMVVVVVALSPVLVPRVFAGHDGLLAATVLALLGAAAAYLLRGVFAGQRRFRWYAGSLAAEGLGRLLPCLALVTFGAASADRFGFGYAMGCGLAALVTLPGLLRGRHPASKRLRADVAHGDLPPLRPMAAAVAWLAGASGLTLMLTNLAPVIVSSRLSDVAYEPSGHDLAASFVSLFMMSRIPLFLFAPVQAFLLPAVTSALARGDLAAARERVRTVLRAVFAVGVPGVVAAGLLGPWASGVFFTAPIQLSGIIAALLAAGAVIMMIAQVLQPTLVALGRHRAATLAWLVASVLFVGLLFAPIPPLPAAVIAQLVAPAVVCVLMTFTLVREVRGRAAAGQGSLATVTNSL